MVTALERTPCAVAPLDEAAMAAARTRQSTLTKPPGSLGRLEDLAVWLAGVTGRAIPEPLRARAVFVLVADHGVARQGVSAYPAIVTPRMVRNFAAGGAAINQLARSAGTPVVLTDLGVASDLSDVPGLIHRAIAPGTADLSAGPTMSHAQALQALEIGITLLEEQASAGLALPLLDAAIAAHAGMATFESAGVPGAS